jgi:hypothetical protein
MFARFGLSIGSDIVSTFSTLAHTEGDLIKFIAEIKGALKAEQKGPNNTFSCFLILFAKPVCRSFAVLTPIGRQDMIEASAQSDRRFPMNFIKS